MSKYDTDDKVKKKIRSWKINLDIPGLHVPTKFRGRGSDKLEPTAKLLLTPEVFSAVANHRGWFGELGTMPRLLILGVYHVYWEGDITLRDKESICRRWF